MTDEATTAVAQGLLDASVVIVLGQIAAGSLPLEPTIAAVTLAELASGPHATDEPSAVHKQPGRFRPSRSSGSRGAHM